MIEFGKLGLFFLQGVTLGLGPCFLSCAPFLLPYIASREKNFAGGLKAALIFGLARTLVYALLGASMGLVGFWLLEIILDPLWKKLIWTFAGIVIIFFGILIIRQKEESNRCCLAGASQNKHQNLFWLGILVALAPCVPLISILIEIIFLAETILAGLLYGLAFGAGTLISPLLLLGAIAPFLPKKMLKVNMNIFYGAFLLAVGGYFVLRVFAPHPVLF